MAKQRGRRVVVTGMAVVSPLGLSLDAYWTGLSEGTSGVGPLTAFGTIADLPLTHGAEAREFTGDIADFGPLDSDRKKAIRKACKVMCRETQMAVAAAQRALHHSGLPAGAVEEAARSGHEPDRFGCVFGSDYMLTLPDDFTSGVARCRDETGRFAFDRWATDGMPQLTPLWLLKYLPNMPASHIAILNDLRGPSNSLTMREASGHLAVGEATIAIRRGAADVMLVGATGTRVHPMKAVHALQTEQVALGGDAAETWSRPFDTDRRGMVLGEGAAVLILEELEHARSRGATIYGEVLGHAAGAVVDARGAGVRRQAIGQALKRAIAAAGLGPEEIGHIQAQGLATVAADAAEAAALGDALGERSLAIPTATPSGHIGHVGAAGGLLGCIAGMLSIAHGELFGVRNLTAVDPNCRVTPSRRGDTPGKSFVSGVTTPQGQAAAVAVGGYEG